MLPLKARWLSAMTTEVQDAVLQRLRVKCAAAYLEGRPRLDAPVVAGLAWRLVQAKLQPTVEHIRTVQGGGSPNVIHPAYRAFLRESCTADSARKRRHRTCRHRVRVMDAGLHLGQ